MLMDIVATISAGVGLAGVIMAIRYFSRGRLPKYTIPAAIGAGMLLFSVWNEYTWMARVADALPDEVVILSAPEDRAAWRPWTYLFPVSSRFVALDRTAILTSAANPALRRMNAMIVQRWAKTLRLPMAFDCVQNLRADLVDGADLAPDGTLTAGATWQAVDPSDEMQRAACKGE